MSEKEFKIEQNTAVEAISSTPGFSEIVRLLRFHADEITRELIQPSMTDYHARLAFHQGALFRVRCILDDLEVLSGKDKSVPPSPPQL